MAHFLPLCVMRHVYWKHCLNRDFSPQRAKVKHLYDPKVVSPFKVRRTDGESALDILEGQVKTPSRVLNGKVKFRAA